LDKGPRCSGSKSGTVTDFPLGFEYDPAGRLTGADGPWGAGSFSYDASGNRLSQTLGAETTTYIFSATSNRLESAAGAEAASFAYNDAGRLVTEGTRGYAYNALKRLDTVTEDSVTVGTYTYDGLGQRVVKTAEGLTTVYLYDLAGRLLTEYTGSGYVDHPDGGDAKAGSMLLATLLPLGLVLLLKRGVSKKGTRGKRMKRSAVMGIRLLVSWLVAVVVGLGGLPGAVSSAHAAETVYYLYNDHLGTPVKATDASGTVVWDAQARPFGTAEVSTETLTVNLRFPGQYYDAESGLHYNYQRTYHPGLGRYLEPDPLGQHDSSNVYPYAINDPVNLTDPTGEVVPVIAWAMVEFGLSLWDAYELVGILTDNCASDVAKYASTAMFLTGILTVGGGGVGVVKHADDIVDIAKAGKKGRTSFYVPPSGEAIPATGYRAVGGPAVERAKSGDIMSASGSTYITFDDLSGLSASETQSLLQLKYAPSHFGTFDTLQLIDDLSIPGGRWNTSPILEPRTSTFPEFGTGGATQAITTTPINNYILRPFGK